MKLRYLAAALALLAGQAKATTIYIVGNGSGTFSAPSTATYAVQVWGAGQAGVDSSGAGGAGGGWSKKNSFSVTGNPFSNAFSSDFGPGQYPFNLGAPGTNGASPNGGDTWFNSVGTVIAPGGGSATTAIGDVTAAGGAGGVYSNFGLPGGGGAGGPAGAGGAGATTASETCTQNCSPGGGGGGNGGGQAATPNLLTSTGGAGGNAANGNVGGAGGFTVGAANGSPGGAGAGGGGGYGDTVTGGNGGNGGDDYDNGGGGAGGPGFGPGSIYTGGNGGTPGGGGGDVFNAVTPGQGGWSVIKITYTGSDPDQIYIYGSITTIQIPSTWTSMANVTNYGVGCSSTTVPITPGASLAVAVNGSCSPTVFTKLTFGGTAKKTIMLLGVGQ